MQDSSTILIFTGSEPEPAEVRRTRGRIEDFARQTAVRAVEMSTDSLKRSVLQAYRNCMEVIEALPDSTAGGTLQTVTFSLAINGEGEVGLLSTGARVGAEVGLTFEVRIDPPKNRDGAGSSGDGE
jgi:hypothetical protein